VHTETGVGVRGHLSYSDQSVATSSENAKHRNVQEGAGVIGSHRQDWQPPPTTILAGRYPASVRSSSSKQLIPSRSVRLL
jgi:hypothetical protein